MEKLTDVRYKWGRKHVWLTLWGIEWIHQHDERVQCSAHRVFLSLVNSDNIWPDFLPRGPTPGKCTWSLMLIESLPAAPDSKKHFNLKEFKSTGLLTDLCASGHQVFNETQAKPSSLHPAILDVLIDLTWQNDQSRSAERRPVITQDLSSSPKRREMKKKKK